MIPVPTYTKVFNTPKKLQMGLNLWPPFIFSRIRVESIQQDYRQIVVSIKLSWLNKNNFGTIFGGALYSMTDPFFATMVLENLSDDYFVWDKYSEIEYIKPGRWQLHSDYGRHPVG